MTESPAMTRARAALALCDAPPSAPVTRHILMCAEGHDLASFEGQTPPWTEEDKQAIECLQCPMPADDREWEEARAGRFIRTWTWVQHPPTMVDAQHLRDALAEVDRLIVELTDVHEFAAYVAKVKTNG